MKLPEALQKALEEEVSRMSVKELASYSRDLSERYRVGKGFVEKEGHRLAYLVSRMPATFAAICKALENVDGVRSVADVGAGPGTGMWAALTMLKGIERIDLYERDKGLIALGKKFGGNENWHEVDLRNDFKMESADLVILSYVVNELPSYDKLVNKLWNLANKFLLIIEPGTPVGFERIRKIREKFLNNIIAPCTHLNACPMQGGDWCHFAARVERTSLHRQVKEGALGHEDEKFSYILLSKEKKELSGERIMRHPQIGKGHVSFTVCCSEGLCKRVVTKKDKERYRLSKKSAWGDVLPR